MCKIDANQWESEHFIESRHIFDSIMRVFQQTAYPMGRQENYFISIWLKSINTDIKS